MCERGSPEAGADLWASVGGAGLYPWQLHPLPCTQRWGWGPGITTKDICSPPPPQAGVTSLCSRKGWPKGASYRGEVLAGRGAPGAPSFSAQHVDLRAECEAAFHAEMLVRVIVIGRTQEVLVVPTALLPCPLPQKVCPCPNPRTLDGNLFGNRVFANMTLKTRSH